MSESRRIVLRISAFICFILGLLLFLFQTQSTGEAPEHFKLMVSLNPIAICGAAMMAFGLAGWASVYLWERKRHMGHL